MSIMVGYDGSDDSRAAVEFAVREAYSRKARLTIVHANAAPIMTVPRDGGMRVPGGDFERQELEAMMRSIEAYALTINPDVKVQTEILDSGGVTAALIAHTARHDLVVTGNRGRGGFASLLLGSVSSQIAAHSHCHTIITRPKASSGPHRDSIVVGIDKSQRNDQVLRFAYETARAHGWGLVAAHAWDDPVATSPTGMIPVTYSPDEQDAQAVTLLGDALHPWRAEYPDVTVAIKSVRGDPRQVLHDLSRGCELLVVGTAGHGQFAGTLLGSVSQAMLHHAQAPVAVVRGHDDGNAPGGGQRNA